jgi:uncharacterized membrane protein
MKYFKAWGATAVFYFVIDLVVRMVVLGPLSVSEMAGITRPMSEVNMSVLMLEYIFLPAIIIYLLLQTTALKSPKKYAFKLGLVLGLAVFGMYELLNSLLLVKWASVGTSVINAVGGALIIGVTTVIATWSLKKFNSK